MVENMPFPPPGAALDATAGLGGRTGTPGTCGAFWDVSGTRIPCVLALRHGGKHTGYVYWERGYSTWMWADALDT